MPWVYRVSNAIYLGDRLTGWELIIEGTAEEMEAAGQMRKAECASSYLSNCYKRTKEGHKVQKIWEREWRPTERELWPSVSCYKRPDRAVLDKATGKVSWEWSWDREQAMADRIAGQVRKKKNIREQQERRERDKTPGVLHKKKNGRGSYIYTRTGRYISNPDDLLLDVIQMGKDNDERRSKGLVPWSSYGYWRLNGGHRD